MEGEILTATTIMTTTVAIVGATILEAIIEGEIQAIGATVTEVRVSPYVILMREG